MPKHLFRKFQVQGLLVTCDSIRVSYDNLSSSDWTSSTSQWNDRLFCEVSSCTASAPSESDFGSFAKLLHSSCSAPSPNFLCNQKLVLCCKMGKYCFPETLPREKAIVSFIYLCVAAIQDFLRVNKGGQLHDDEIRSTVCFRASFCSAPMIIFRLKKNTNNLIWTLSTSFTCGVEGKKCE